MIKKLEHFWKETITISPYTVKELIQLCNEPPFCLFPGAYKAMCSQDFRPATTKLTKQLVCVQLCQIGVIIEKTIDFIEAASTLHDLNFCSPGDAPYIRLQITEQSQEDVFYLAMRPIRNTEGVSSIFTLKRVGNSLVIDAKPLEDSAITPSSLFIFCSYT